MRPNRTKQEGVTAPFLALQYIRVVRLNVASRFRCAYFGDIAPGQHYHLYGRSAKPASNMTDLGNRTRSIPLRDGNDNHCSNRISKLVSAGNPATMCLLDLRVALKYRTLLSRAYRITLSFLIEPYF